MDRILPCVHSSTDDLAPTPWDSDLTEICSNQNGDYKPSYRVYGAMLGIDGRYKIE